MPSSTPAPASPVLISIFDIPWTPLFIAAIFVFHPMLGYLALLARETAAPPPDNVEWYPVGNLVMWCGIVSAVVVFGLILIASGLRS